MSKDYDVRGAFEAIELNLISSMARNVKRHLNEEEKEGFNWNQWQAEQIKSLRRFQNHNQKEYGPHFKKINDSIADMIRSNANDAAVAEHMRFLLNDLERGNLEPEGDFFGINKPKLDALIKATTDDMEKAEHAMLRKVDDEYRKTIFNAQVYANTGAGTLKQAVDMATKDFLRKGIDCIRYKDGRQVNIASYAEMAVRTANTRAVCMAEGDIRKERGWHLVRISQYGQCSEICKPWQGRIYVDDVYSGGTTEESKEKGYPLLSEAIDGGLFHPNCKHRSTTYFPELDDDVEPVGETENHPLQKEYNENHRELQKQKRIEAGSLDEENKKIAKVKRVEAEKKEERLITEISSSNVKYRDLVLNSDITLETEKSDPNTPKNKIQVNAKKIQLSKESKFDFYLSKRSEAFAEYIDVDKIEKINDTLSTMLDKSRHRDSDNAPKIVICRTKDPWIKNDYSGEIRGSGAYDYKNNVVYLSDFLVRKDDGLANFIQTGTVCSDDFRSASIHEMFHWEDAESFRKEKGISKISSSEQIKEYDAYCQSTAKENIDKLTEQGYNVIGCSPYALANCDVYKYDETWTEYRTKEIMKGVFGYEVNYGSKSGSTI